MTLRWLAITCDAQRLLTKSQMWGKLWHATLLAGGWVGVRSGREKHLPGKTPQTAPPGQDLNVVNAATKVDPRAMAEPGSRYPVGDGPLSYGRGVRRRMGARRKRYARWR